MKHNGARLIELQMLSIENKMVRYMDYSKTVDDFVNIKLGFN